MSLPIFLHSGMQNAPALQLSTINDVLNACLVTGFNLQSVSSASCLDGVVTLNFATAPGFSAKDTITIAGATNPIYNGNFRVIFSGSNQITYAVPSGINGVVAGVLTAKFAALGWESLFSNTTTRVFRSLTSDSQACLRVQINNPYASTQGFESMTDIDTGVNGFPTTMSVNSVYLGGYTSQQWMLIGDDKFFYFFCKNGNGFNQFFFGDIVSFMPVDNYCAVISRSFTYPFGSQNYDAFNVMKSLGGVVGKEIIYLIAVATKPLLTDIYTNNIVIKNNVFFLENTSNVYSIRGVCPGALEVLAQADPSTSLFSILDNINGITGRVILVRANGNIMLAYHLDMDWRL